MPSDAGGSGNIRSIQAPLITERWCAAGGNDEEHRFDESAVRFGTTGELSARRSIRARLLTRRRPARFATITLY